MNDHFIQKIAFIQTYLTPSEKEIKITKRRKPKFTHSNVKLITNYHKCLIGFSALLRKNYIY